MHTWRKSSRCGTSGCLEMAATDSAVHIRDKAGRQIVVDRDAWAGFIAAIRDGHYDTPAAPAQP